MRGRLEKSAATAFLCALLHDFLYYGKEHNVREAKAIEKGKKGVVHGLQEASKFSAGVCRA